MVIYYYFNITSLEKIVSKRKEKKTLHRNIITSNMQRVFEADKTYKKRRLRILKVSPFVYDINFQKVNSKKRNLF